MVPEGWRTRRLAECAESITSGGTPRVGQSDYYDGDIPFLKIDDLTTNQGLYLKTASTSITQKALEETSVKLYPENTVLVTMYGTIGAVGITEIPMAANQAIGAFLKLTGATPEFLAYLLSREAPALSRKAGQTTQSNINGRILKNHEVVLPPLSEQRKIAAILSSVDDAIEKTQAVIDQVQVVKRGLMQELLARGLPGRHTRFKRTRIGQVPEDWQVLAIGELGRNPRDPRSVVRTGPFGSSMKTKDFCASGVPVITIQSLGEGELHAPGLFFTSREKADELSEYTVAEGDLVFSRVADIGRSLAIDAGLAGWLISPNLIRIRPDRRKADARFMMYAITLARVVIRQVVSVSGNAGRPVVSSSILRSLRIPVPPMREQHEIARVGLGMERRIRKETESLALLEQVKSALMTVLLTGELRVTLAPEVSWP